jgi:leader peptidase (prepilin peptidase)/N-methyltransferase
MTTSHHALLVVFWTVLGSCVGSFLNVCVYRIPRRMSVLRPRSRCPRCDSAIQARDNIPVVGWLILRARCRDCRGRIPVRYPAVELAAGAAFALPYQVAVATVTGDPWERIGAVSLAGILLATWTALVAALFLALVAYDTRRPVTVRPAAGECEGPPSSALLPRADRG